MGLSLPAHNITENPPRVHDKSRTGRTFPSLVLDTGKGLAAYLVADRPAISLTAVLAGGSADPTEGIWILLSMAFPRAIVAT